MHDPEGLSATHEMYLKVLYRLQLENEVGRVRDMAKGLGITPGTVSAVLKKLERTGLVLHDHYGMVKLTPAGHRVAECVVRRFEIIKALLIEVLGLVTEVAEVDACMMEHAVSPATVNRMESMLHLVRTGQIVMQPMHGIEASVATCSDCEAVGTCQAVVALNRPASWPERN
jgi:DtxR family Mn-dependent transcriptional regulator